MVYDDLRNIFNNLENNSHRKSSIYSHSKSLPSEDLVDGSAPARHNTKAVAGHHEGVGPAVSAPSEIENWRKNYITLPGNLLEFLIVSLGFFWIRYHRKLSMKWRFLPRSKFSWKERKWCFSGRNYNWSGIVQDSSRIVLNESEHENSLEMKDFFDILRVFRMRTCWRCTNRSTYWSCWATPWGILAGLARLYSGSSEIENWKEKWWSAPKVRLSFSAYYEVSPEHQRQLFMRKRFLPCSKLSLGAWKIKKFSKIEQLSRNYLKSLRMASEVFRGENSYKINESFQILRVFWVGIWLTVHCPLDITKLLGDPMGGLGQRLWLYWTCGDCILKETVKIGCVQILFKF